MADQRKQSLSQLVDRIREDAPVTRRDYLRILVTISGGLAVGTAAIAAGIFPAPEEGPAEPVKVADDIAKGEAVRFSFPDPKGQAMAMRLMDGSLVAYSSACTHLGCTVLWLQDEQRMECPCHNGSFDPRTGEVLAGPPPRPLPRIVLEERRDGIWAVGTELA